MQIITLVQQMIILIGYMAVGFIGGKTKIINEDSTRFLSSLVIMLINPCQVASSTMRAVHTMTYTDLLLLIVIAVALYFAIIFASLFLPKLLRTDGAQANAYKYMLPFSNIGFLGYPVITSLFGDEGKPYVTMFILVFYFFVFTYGKAAISGEKLKIDFKTFCHPMIIGCTIGLIIYVTNLQVPEIIYKFGSTVGSMATPLSMIVIGASLAFTDPVEVFRPWQIYVLALIKLIIIPIIVWFVLGIFLKKGMLRTITTIIFAMPAASNSAMLAYKYGGDTKLTASGVFITTLLSAFTIPVIAFFISLF